MFILGVSLSFLVIINFKYTYGKTVQDKRELLIYTMASETTDGYFRYIRSLEVYGLKNQKTFGLGQNFTGMGIKIKLFRQEVQKYKDRPDVVILFTDSYDAVFSAGKEDILGAFDKFKANIVFSTETNCWPLERLKDQYPDVQKGYKYLNSGGIIGYAPQIYHMLPEFIGDKDDDQYYYSRIFLEESFRKSLGIVLDTRANIFLSLYGVEDNITMLYLENDTKIFNEYTETTPCIVHANGFTKMILHALGSYLAKSWTKSEGCLACLEDRINFDRMSERYYPTVLMGVFIDRPTPFLQDKLNKISNMTYPKKKIFLFVYNRIYKYEETVKSWIREIANEYLGARYYWRAPNSNLEWNNGEVRAIAIRTCLNISCDLFFSMDSHVNIDNPNTLQLLVSYNRSIMTPIMKEEGSNKSTFWGAVTPDLKFKDTFDYEDIITNQKRGFWNVPQILHIYVIWRFMLENPNFEIYLASDSSPDMAISVMVVTMKHFSMFMIASNLHDYGHLSNMDHVFIDHLHNDLWQVNDNPKDWEMNYLHADYTRQLDGDAFLKKVCNDGYMFPLFSEKFCQEMSEAIKHHQQWNNIHEKDFRLYSGYANVSTGQAVINQIGYEKEWTSIIENYISFIAEKVYFGNDDKNLEALRKDNSARHPTNRSHLESFQNKISYTVTVALNNYGSDLQVEDSRMRLNDCPARQSIPAGWVMLNLGWVKDYQQEISIVNGTRYSIVSFVYLNST